MHKKVFHILFIFIFEALFSPKIMAEDGLRFKSNEVVQEERTGVDFTCEAPIAYSHRFSIDFLLSFRQSETHFGNILTLLENNNNLLQIRYRNPDIFVVHNANRSEFQINLEEGNFSFNKWIPIHISIDTDEDSIRFSMGNIRQSAAIDFPSHSSFRLTLGAIDKYGLTIDEVPSMAVKNVKISIDKQLKYQWTFAKSEHLVLNDERSKQKAHLLNPDWVANYHDHWSCLKTIDFKALPTIAFDKKNEKLHFVFFNGHINSLDLKTMTSMEVGSKTSAPCMEKAQQCLVDERGYISSYSFIHDTVSTYLPEEKRWAHSVPSSADNAPKLWHHNKMLHPLSGDITVFGGYGYYTYYNDIKSFSKEKKRWEKLPFKGDTIAPRYMASLGVSAQSDSVYYLFGGTGNEKGEQILGRRFFYDLYKIDFRTSEINLLWKVKRDGNLLPVNSLITVRDDRYFYTLLFSSLKNKTHLRTAKIDMDKGKIEFIGDSIPYTFKDIESFADLYYWKSQNKLLALTMQLLADTETYRIGLYSINYEPKDLPTALPAKNRIRHLLLFIAFVGILSVLFGSVFWKRKTARQNAASEMQSIENPAQFEIPQSNTIRFFGGFRAFDKQGKNITYRFSPIIKELYTLLLLNSLDNEKGISSKRMQEYLWSDKSAESAKNNRGVNIKKLRTILEDIDGTEITLENNYWLVKNAPTFFNDLEHIYQLINDKTTHRNERRLWEALETLKCGAPLRDCTAVWLDPYKDKITETVVTFLEKRLQDKKLKTRLRLIIAETICEFDEMNENALQAKCQILIAQGKRGMALTVYKHYQTLHLKLYGEEYKVRFKKLK